MGLGSGSGLWACGQQVAPETEGGGGDAGRLGASAGHASPPRPPGPLACLLVRPQHVRTLTCTLPLTCPCTCPLFTHVHVRTDRPAPHKLTGFQSHPVLIFLTRKLQFRPRLGLSQTLPLPHISFKAEMLSFRMVCSLQNARPSPATLEPTPSFLLSVGVTSPLLCGSETHTRQLMPQLRGQRPVVGGWEGTLTV